MILKNHQQNFVILEVYSIEIKETNKGNNLTSSEDISYICRTANFKLLALRRVRKYLHLEQPKELRNTFTNNPIQLCSNNVGFL